jgi:hypothetical protein
MADRQPNAQATEAARKRAEEKFKVRADQRADAPKARAEYYAAQQAAIDRMSVLRAQRLARDQKNGKAT